MSYSNFIVLITIEFVTLFCTYRSIKDVFAPAIISIATITLSTILCLYMIYLWEINIADETILIFVVGFIAMYMANYLQKKTIHVLSIKRFVDVNFDKNKTNIGLICSVAFTILYIREIQKTGQTLGLGIIEAISTIKEDDSISINQIVRQLQKIVFALGYIHLYIFIGNLFKKERFARNIFHIIPPLCVIVCCVFSGVRTDILKIFAASIFLVSIFCRIYKVSMRKYIRRIGFAAIILALLGGASNKLIKGEKQSINYSYNSYQITAYYIGSPIQTLNMKIQKGLKSFKDKKIWGRTTFSRQYTTLEQIGLPIYDTRNMDKGSEFLILDEQNGIMANVDTILGAPVIDFGISGMILYIFIVYSLLSYFYYRTTIGSISPLSLILYSFFYVIPLMAYYGNLCNLIMTTPYLIQVFFIILIYNFYKDSKKTKILFI